MKEKDLENFDQIIFREKVYFSHRYKTGVNFRLILDTRS